MYNILGGILRCIHKYNTGRHDVDIKQIEVDSDVTLESYTVPPYSAGYTDYTQTIRRKTVNSNSDFDAMVGEIWENGRHRVTADL